jgi:hypothetical protein
MKPTYGWIVTKDFIEDESKCIEVDVIGPRGCPFTKEELISKGTPFKLFDDDGNLYYEGFVIADANAPESIFGPLDDYGGPNAGCVDMKVLNSNKEWEFV